MKYLTLLFLLSLGVAFVGCTNVSPLPPNNPSGFTVSTTSSTTAQLRWQAVAGASNYIIERKTGSAAFLQIATLPASSTSYQDSGLIGETTYIYRLKTSTGSLESAGVEFSITTGVTPPKTPDDFAARVVSSTRITLSWSAVERANSYTLERKNGTSAFAQVATLSNDTTQFEDRNLQPSTAYIYRVMAVNAGGSGEPGEVGATTLDPLSVRIASPSTTHYTRSNVQLRLTVTGQPETVEILRDGQPLATFTNSLNYTWDVSAIPEASYNLVARASRAGEPVVTSTPLRVVVDRTPPRVVSSTPSADQTNVERRPNLDVEFSEPILASSLTSNTALLQRVGGPNFPTTTQGNGNILRVTSPSELRMLSRHQLTLSNTITDLAGNALVQPYTLSFTTRDGRWDRGTIIENTTYYTDNQQLGLDDSGNVIAVWSENRVHETSEPLYARHYVPSRGWENPVIVAELPGEVGQARLTVGPNGDAFLVWSQGQRYSGVWSIWMSLYNPSNGWGVPTLVETDETTDAFSPFVDLSPTGHFMVAWNQWSGGSGSHINSWVRAYHPQSGWSQPVLLDISDFSTFSPRVFVDRHGNALAVWQQYESFGGLSSSVWFRRFENGQWNDPQPLEDSPNYAEYPAIVMNDDGVALAIWGQSDTSDQYGTYSLWGRRFTPGSGWGAAQAIESSNNRIVQGQYGLTLNPSGVGFAIWLQWVDSQPHVWVNRLDPNGGWGNGQQISIERTTYHDGPSIGVDHEGRAIALWGGLTGELVSSRYVGATGWSTPSRVAQVMNFFRPMNTVFDPEGNGFAIAENSFNTWVFSFR